jgi:predicted CXXCH cytochrome family protein
MRRSVLLLVAGVWAVLLTAIVHGQVEVKSPSNKHNLSVSGPGPVKATTETEICIFCHTPHNANPAVPLWSHTMSAGVNYLPYTSSTLNAAVGVPTGSSKLCLSCHDGTVAIGSTMNYGVKAMSGVNGAGQLTGASVIGTDLRNDHPISFVPIVAPDIKNPPVGSPVKLDANGQVQCRTCHDPHRMDIDPTTLKFLVVNNSASGLCVTCHDKQYWATNPSTHKTSNKNFTAVQGAHTGYTTVATNGCESCHTPHGATAPQRNLVGAEELTCQPCHGTNAIGRNITAEFQKTYRHPTYSTTPSVHDAAESPTNASHTLPETSAAAARHAECADCHNSHASYAATAAAPKASGKLAGVWGIDSNGSLKMPAGTPSSVNEYEICYKCHADSANKPQPVGPVPPYPNRVATQFNKRLQFDPGNPSYHPIEAAGKDRTGTSLLPPWTVDSIVKCTDCHDNDTGPKAPTPGVGPSGPHGSQYAQILVARFDRDTTNTTESAAAYALCYKCHDRNKVRNNATFATHSKHITDYQASCAICHDPHGVSSTQGNATNNPALVNFDKRFVTARNGVLEYSRTTKNCTLVCHGATHPR